MNWIEILGYAASGAVFATFWMQTLIALRAVAIVGNILFLSYGVYSDLGNIVLLHTALLPLNVIRLVQSIRLRRKIHDMAHLDYDPKSLVAFMSGESRKAGDVLFRRGDPAHDIYFLASGRVRVDELEVELSPGQLIGEIAMFTREKRRTQTVTCVDDCELMRISEEKALQLYAENPEFGLFVTKMAVQRLSRNAEETPLAETA